MGSDSVLLFNPGVTPAERIYLAYIPNPCSDTGTATRTGDGPLSDAFSHANSMAYATFDVRIRNGLTILFIQCCRSIPGQVFNRYFLSFFAHGEGFLAAFPVRYGMRTAWACCFNVQILP